MEILKQLTDKQKKKKPRKSNTSVWCCVVQFTNFLCKIIMVYLLGNDSCLLRDLAEAIRQGKEVSHALKAHK